MVIIALGVGCGSSAKWQLWRNLLEQGGSRSSGRGNPQLGLAAQSQDDLKNGLCPHQPLQTADSVGWEINYYTPKASLITLFHKVPHRAG